MMEEVLGQSQDKSFDDVNTEEVEGCPEFVSRQCEKWYGVQVRWVIRMFGVLQEDKEALVLLIYESEMMVIEEKSLSQKLQYDDQKTTPQDIAVRRKNRDVRKLLKVLVLLVCVGWMDVKKVAVCTMKMKE